MVTSPRSPPRRSAGRAPKSVLQFRVTLRHVSPKVWRRIQVPSSYSFWDLHVAIQDAMGWLDCHLHAFRVVKGMRKTNATFGIPDDEPFPGMPKVLPDWEVLVADWMTRPGHSVTYEYDFGDSWEHVVELETVMLAEPRARYPRCVDGARACPPEDVGGVPGYEGFLAALADPRHQEHDDYVA